MTDCTHEECVLTICKSCEEWKLECEFNKYGTKGKREGSCKVCRSKAAAISAKRRVATPEGREKRNTYHREYQASNRESFREANLMRVYGITQEDYDRKLKEQDGRCAICKKLHVPGDTKNTFYLHLDHDHSTNSLRGLLCNNCNLMLGQAKDSIETLANAISYLDYYRSGGET